MHDNSYYTGNMPGLSPAGYEAGLPSRK